MSFLVTSQIDINFAVSFWNNNVEGIVFDQISYTWFEFWIFATILGYLFLNGRKFWDMVFAKVY